MAVNVPDWSFFTFPRCAVDADCTRVLNNVNDEEIFTICLCGGADIVAQTANGALDNSCSAKEGNSNCGPFLEEISQGDVFDGYSVQFSYLASGGNDMRCAIVHDEDMTTRIGSFCFTSEGRIGYGNEAAISTIVGDEFSVTYTLNFMSMDCFDLEVCTWQPIENTSYDYDGQVRISAGNMIVALAGTFDTEPTGTWDAVSDPWPVKGAAFLNVASIAILLATLY